MGIFKRVKHVAQAEVNGFLDKIEDPIKMVYQYLREMEEEIAKGEQALAEQIFLEKRQRVCMANTEEVIAKRSRQAQLAVDQGEDQFARLALQEKVIQEKNLHHYQEQYETIKQQTTLLYEKLNQLKMKYDEMKMNRQVLISRANTAGSIKQINQMVASFNTDHISNGFARMEDRVLMMEADIEAHQQLAQPRRNLSNYPIDPLYQEQVQKELEKLKEFSNQTV